MLINAAKNGNIKEVESLLNKGVDPNAQDIHGISALHSAAYNGHTEIVELLLAKKANIDAKDDFGYTALHLAAESGHIKIVELLLDKINSNSLKKSFIYGGMAMLGSLAAAASLHFASSEPGVEIAAIVFVATSIPIGLVIGLTVRYCTKPESKLQHSGVEEAQQQEVGHAA